jgi:hypothetical protein
MCDVGPGRPIGPGSPPPTMTEVIAVIFGMHYDLYNECLRLDPVWAEFTGDSDWDPSQHLVKSKHFTVRHILLLVSCVLWNIFSGRS